MDVHTYVYEKFTGFTRTAGNASHPMFSYCIEILVSPHPFLLRAYNARAKYEF